MLKLFFLVPYNIFIWLYVVIIFTIARWGGYVLALFYKDREKGFLTITYPLLKFWFILLNIKVNVKGIEHVPKNKPVIVASNHQSYLDTVIFQCYFPKVVNFFAKKELIRTPLLGKIMLNQGHFIVDRKNPKKALKQMKHVRKSIEKGKTILIFPEGTRTLTGKINRFKRGLFHIAAQTGVDILPCYLNGTYQTYNKHSFLFHPGKTITLTICPAVKTTKATEKSLEKESALNALNETFDALLTCEKNEFNTT